ncbi:MAG: hypothetical protein ACI9SK_001502 [Zhongshania sp.]
MGAILRATVPAEISRQGGPNRYETFKHCEIQQHREWRDEVAGYDVSYHYRDEIYHSRLPYNPGKEIEIEAKVTPRD